MGQLNGETARIQLKERECDIPIPPKEFLTHEHGSLYTQLKVMIQSPTGGAEKPFKPIETETVKSNW